MRSSVVTKWVDFDSMKSLGLTSGVKKVCLFLLIVGDLVQTFYADYDLLILLEALLFVILPL